MKKISVTFGTGLILMMKKRYLTTIRLVKQDKLQTPFFEIFYLTKYFFLEMSGNSLFVFSLLLSTSLCLPCLPGWIAFGTSCYGIFSYEMNWYDAQKVS